jgi:hypothetical protein
MPGTTPTPANYSALVDEVVTQQYMRGEWDNTKKLRKFWNELDTGRSIEYDASGKYIEWKARIGEFSAGYRGDLVQRQFSRKQQRVTYTAPYSFLEIPALLSERDLQFLNSPEAIVRFQDDYLGTMGADFAKSLNNKLLSENTTGATVMGQAATSAGGDVPLYGLLYLFQHGTAQAYNPDTNTTSGAVGATDKEVLPNGTYCGVTTNPVTGVTGVDGQVIGSTAPVIINDTSTAWTGTNTWASTCLEVMDYAITRLTRSPMADEGPNIAITNRTRFLALKAKIRSATTQQVVLVDASGRNPNIGAYGERVIPYNGLEATFDENCPSVTYFLNTKQMKYKIFPQIALAKVDGGAIKGNVPEPFRVAQMPDIDQGGWKVVAVQCAQLIANPYFQGASYGAA